MSGLRQRRSRGLLVVLFAVGAAAMVLVGCGDDDSDDGSTDTGGSTTGTAAVGSTDTTATDSGAAGNACPADGCSLEIDSIEADDSGELIVTFDANFTPDFSANHIHIYWDTYTADQVSADAADRDVEQGAWVATDDYPTYLTEADVSIETRGESTTLCVTAADGDHNVIDSTVFQCVDVSDAF